MARLYDAWPGRNRFLPCGCILGPVGDSCANIYVYCCFVSALIPYCIFILPVVWQVSPAIPILFLLSVCFTILFLILTQCTDPGIIPRRPYLQRKPDVFEKYLLETLPGQQNNPSKKRRFCETCGIYRPPRTSHCSTCNNCVQVFDHHCPFVNNCIGKRNYRFFVLFLAGIMLSMGTLIVNIVIFGIAKAGSKVDSTIVIIVCSVAVGIIGIPLLIFFMFHIFLMITGKTTRQLIKNVNEQEPQQNQNQWCKVDPPIINYFEQVDESTIDLLKNSMQKLFEMKPISNNNNNPKNSDNTKIVNEAEDYSNIVINNQLAEQNQ